MDSYSPRTTLVMLAAVAAITVAQRVSQQQQRARLTAEAERLAATTSWLTRQQQELRRGQLELLRRLSEHDTATDTATSRLEVMTSELLDDHHDRMRAFAGAYEAVLAPRPDERAQARRIHYLRTRWAPS